MNSSKYYNQSQSISSNHQLPNKFISLTQLSKINQVIQANTNTLTSNKNQKKKDKRKERSHPKTTTHIYTIQEQPQGQNMNESSNFPLNKKQIFDLSKKNNVTENYNYKIQILTNENANNSSNNNDSSHNLNINKVQIGQNQVYYPPKIINQQNYKTTMNNQNYQNLSKYVHQNPPPSPYDLSQYEMRIENGIKIYSKKVNQNPNRSNQNISKSLQTKKESAKVIYIKSDINNKQFQQKSLNYSKKIEPNQYQFDNKSQKNNSKVIRQSNSSASQTQLINKNNKNSPIIQSVAKYYTVDKIQNQNYTHNQNQILNPNPNPNQNQNAIQNYYQHPHNNIPANNYNNYPHNNIPANNYNNHMHNNPANSHTNIPANNLTNSQKFNEYLNKDQLPPQSNQNLTSQTRLVFNQFQVPRNNISRYLDSDSNLSSSNMLSYQNIKITDSIYVTDSPKSKQTTKRNNNVIQKSEVKNIFEGNSFTKPQRIINQHSNFDKQVKQIIQFQNNARNYSPANPQYYNKFSRFKPESKSKTDPNNQYKIQINTLFNDKSNQNQRFFKSKQYSTSLPFRKLQAQERNRFKKFKDQFKIKKSVPNLLAKQVKSETELEQNFNKKSPTYEFGNRNNFFKNDQKKFEKKQIQRKGTNNQKKRQLTEYDENKILQNHTSRKNALIKFQKPTIYLIPQKLDFLRKKFEKLCKENDKIHIYLHNQELNIIKFDQFRFVFYFPSTQNGIKGKYDNLYTIRLNQAFIQAKNNQFHIKNIEQLVQIKKYIQQNSKSLNSRINILVKKSNPIIKQVIIKLGNPQYKISKFYTINELISVYKRLELSQTIILVTDQVPDIVEIFKKHKKFLCIVIPKNKMYEAQRFMYSTSQFKWIFEMDPKIIAEQINTYIQELLQNQTRRSSQNQSLDRLNFKYNLLISEQIKDSIKLSIESQYFTPYTIKNRIKLQKINIFITDEDNYDIVSRVSNIGDKIIVLANNKKNEFKYKSDKIILITSNISEIQKQVKTLFKKPIKRI